MEDYAGVREFLDSAKRSGQLPTYSAVRLHSGYCEFVPGQVSFKSRFSMNVALNVPLIAASMDTVSEVDMAIAMARLGGLAVIHRNMDPATQRKMVARVKHAQHGYIPDAVAIPAHWTIDEFLRWKDAKGYRFGRFLVRSGNNGAGRLKGMLTSKDLQFCRDHSLRVAQVMTPRSKMIVGKRDMSKQAAYDLMCDEQIESLPVPNGDGTHGLFLFDDLRRIFEEKGSIANVDQNDRLRTAAATGTGPDEIARAEELLRGGVDVIVVETAHIHTKYGRETIMEVLRLAEGKADVVAGNISNPVSAVALGKWGVQGIKIGQGPGSICTTRVKAGIGAPQAWAVAACAQALREANLGHIPVCADGGIVNPGDVTVAIGLGAESVMIGSLFAGTDETPGETYYDSQGKQVKKYRGMGSKAALMKSGSANRYAQGHLEASERISEGIESEVPYKGPLSLVFNELRGGLGQGMFYTGCRTIDDLRKFSFPYIASSEAVREASPHDVKVTNAA